MSERNIINFKKSFENIEKRAKKADRILTSARETINSIKKDPDNKHLQAKILDDYNEILKMLGEFSRACSYCRSYGFRSRIRSHTHRVCCGKYDELLEMRGKIEAELRELDLVG